MEGIFDKTDSRENLACGQHAGRARFDELAKTVDAEIVNRPRALELSKADERHLHQPAFIRSVKVCVRLDAVDEDRAVRVVNVAIHEDPHR